MIAASTVILYIGVDDRNQGILPCGNIAMLVLRSLSAIIGQA
jgi:hypothetical protein